MRIAQHLILGGTQTKAPASIAAHNASNAIEFFRAAGKKQLLPLNAADRVWSKSVRVRKGGEHQSQILSSKRSITCPLKRGRSRIHLMMIATKDDFEQAFQRLRRRDPAALAGFILSLAQESGPVGDHVRTFIVGDDVAEAATSVRERIKGLEVPEEYAHRRVGGRWGRASSTSWRRSNRWCCR
jgi:hypothetical protein